MTHNLLTTSFALWGGSVCCPSTGASVADASAARPQREEAKTLQPITAVSAPVAAETAVTLQV